MKIHLLSVAALLFAGSIFAQEDVDITPAKYKFADQPVGEYKLAAFYGGANANNHNGAAVAPTTIYEEHFNDGAVTIHGAIVGGFFEQLQAGTSIVDLGGEVGKVLCINGMNSNYNTVYGMNYAKCTSGLNWFNFNWWMDSQNTPLDGTAEAPNIRVRIVLNIYANALGEATNIVNSAYMMSGQNNPLPAGSNTAEGVAIVSGSFAEYDEDGEPVMDDDENYVYDPTKWMVYEWDAYAAEDGIPMRLKMEMNQGNMANATIFIKEISFTQLAENPEPIIGTRKKTYVKYEVDPQASSIATVKGEKGYTEYFNLSGMKVNADNLTQGVYIVKNGATTSKVVVK